MANSCGDTLAEDVVAAADVPGFRNSQMDGFALRAEDLSAACEANPVRLPVGAPIAAGATDPGTLQAGRTLPIMTGAALPAGADAVVPLEDAREAPDGIEFVTSPQAGSFIRPAGMDLRSGELVLPRGRVLQPADLGLLASLGLSAVRRVAPPRVAILGTGDELVGLGEPLGFGQIHDSNAYALAAACTDAGAVPTCLGIVGDTRAALQSALDQARAYDLVLTTGGVSVGKFDYVKEILDELGVRREFWKVAQKPGKPITFGAHPEGTLYFGLPGNPVSAMVCFELYVAPAIRAILGQSALFRPTVEVELGEDLRTSEKFEELVRCERRGGETEWRPAPVVTLAGSQNSGALHSLSRAEYLAISRPGQSSFARGDCLEALDLKTTRRTIRHPFS